MSAIRHEAADAATTAPKVQRLVHMANQIAAFFETFPEPRGRLAVTEHLQKFWDPHMRRTLLAHAEAGGAGLSPLALAAVLAL
ncbi:formate dehydrogenase subunit delta [Zavarzinia sp. CC-PAN008]|uniref:formate dehydrogenase subunit delta n=1 Tax=Zavarzinia sp. CC-PAN008 TaxID=3243332 RepID=UPI003F742EC4